MTNLAASSFLRTMRKASFGGIARLKRSWNRFSETDPLWFVLTDSQKKGQKWDPVEFFETGRRTVHDDLGRIRAVYPQLRLGSAMDFGCGVGRLSRALAEPFARVTGVDVSAGMLEHARRYNQDRSNIDFKLNDRPGLRAFGSGQFDLVYSLITLQHMPNELALDYIREFLRVAKPGGVVFFQVPYRIRVERQPPRPFTLWPDTLIKRFLRDRAANRYLLEMHAIPEAEVRGAIQRGGGRVLDVYPYELAGPDCPSNAYIAVKD